MISAIQFRGETDPDILPHVHQRCVDEKVVQTTREVEYCKQTLIHVLQDVLTGLAKMKVSIPCFPRRYKLLATDKMLFGPSGYFQSFTLDCGHDLTPRKMHLL